MFNRRLNPRDLDAFMPTPTLPRPEIVIADVALVRQFHRGRTPTWENLTKTHLVSSPIGGSTVSWALAIQAGVLTRPLRILIATYLRIDI